MNETENQEIEIDLLELLQEFKNNLAKIIGVTLLFAAAAALYVFALTAPKYSYTQLVDCATLSDKDKISFVNIFNEDAVSIKGHGKMWKEPKKFLICLCYFLTFALSNNILYPITTFFPLRSSFSKIRSCSRCAAVYPRGIIG